MRKKKTPEELAKEAEMEEEDEFTSKRKAACIHKPLPFSSLSRTHSKIERTRNYMKINTSFILLLLYTNFGRYLRTVLRLFYL